MSRQLFGKKNALARWFFHRYAAFRLRRTFGRILVRQLDVLALELSRGPVIAAPNHVAFWDVFAILTLERALGADGYALMDRVNYEKLPFFSWIGALPLDRDRPKSAFRDLMQSTQALDAPGRLLFIFPQGRQLPPHVPLAFHKGVAVAARKKRVPIVPIGLRYDFGEDPKPSLFISVGAPLAARASDAQTVGELERSVAHELSIIDQELLSPSDSFRPLLSSRGSGLPLGSQLLARLSGARRG